MEKQIEKGAFVLDQRHADYGVGRVVELGAFVTRVLFVHGGLRVFRVDDVGKLKVTSPPALEDVQALAEKEALLTRGLLEAKVRPPKEAAPSRKRKKPIAKALR